MSKQFYFFVGTTAELIKLLPVMKEFTRRKLDYQLISSGQNDLANSELLGLAGKEIDFCLHQGGLKPSTATLVSWFFRAYRHGRRRLGAMFAAGGGDDALMVVHGDTLSSVLGAWLAAHFKISLAHVEAGLRSYNFFNPFPEEINRVMVSRLADIHFCPGDWACRNLSRVRGEKVNTGHNTLLDSLRMALEVEDNADIEGIAGGEPFCLFILHRQENLFNGKTVKYVIKRMVDLSASLKCVLVMHRLTRAVLEKFDLMDTLRANPGIVLLPRQPYVSFVHLLQRSRFIVTDGGSNQEEAYYLGKPCLLLRKRTERREGLGENVVLSQINPDTVERFLADPGLYRRSPLAPATSPSRIIVDRLCR